jgi:uncharacterized membrane protein YccC
MSQQPDSYTELIYRVGTFFLLVGIGLVVLFILSDAAQQTTFSYFCWGTILLVIGFMFRSQYKRSIPSSGRFSIFKRLKPKPKEKK